MMAKISKIAVPGVTEPYDIEAYKALSIPFGQVDSTSTDTAYTAQIEGITSLYDGVCVYLKNGIITSNKNGFTLNVNGLGAKPVYGTLAAATKSGTVFNINYTMLFVYNSSRVSGGCWDIFYGYNSDTNTIAYNVRVGSTPPATSNKLVKYGIAFTKTDGKLLSSNTTGTTATSKALTSVEFDPYAPMYYYPTTAVAANGVPAASYTYEQYSTVDLRYSFNAGATLVAGSPVYIRCVPQSDGTVKLDGNNCIVQTLPSTDDSKVYIYLGYAYSTTNIFFDIKHPVYCIRDGRREFWHGDKHYWTDITNPPSTYTPSSHTHNYTDINGLGSLATVNTVPWSSVTDTPPTYTPSPHSHDYAPIVHTHVLDDIIDADDKQDKMFIGQIDNAGADNYVTAADILGAFNQNKDICITYTDNEFGVLKFTSWNTAGNGTVIAANAIIQANNHLYVYDLHAYTGSNTWIHEAYALAPESHDHSWNEIINPPDFALTDSPEFTGIPTAPTPTADNDSMQIANTSWVRARIDGLGTVFNLKGTKTNAASLPTTNNIIGDVWYVAAESVGYIWLKDEGNTERWEKFGEPIELPATYTPSAHSHAWSEITSTPATYTPSAHTHDYAASSHSHAWSAITNPPSSYTPSGHTHAWANISDPPSSYTPSAHTHTWANISNPPSSYTPSAHSHAWSQITNTPATYTPSTHTHSDLAPINSPQFTGNPTAPSPNEEDNSTAIANTSWVNSAISSAIEALPDLPETYTPSAHSHAWSEITSTPATYTPSAHTHTWVNISNPPSSYTPSAHSHAWSNITSPPASYTPSSHSHSWSQITNTPANYTPSSHSHSWSEITNQPTIPTASTITPNDLDYTASVGTLTEYAHADHVHQIPRIPIVHVNGYNSDADDIYIVSDDENFYQSFRAGQYFYLENLTDITPHSDCTCYYGQYWSAPFVSDGLPLSQVLGPNAHVLCVMVEDARDELCIRIVGSYETSKIITITLTSETDINDNLVWNITPAFSKIDWTAIEAGEKIALIYYNENVYTWSGAKINTRVSSFVNRISLVFTKLTSVSNMLNTVFTYGNKLKLSAIAISKRAADWSEPNSTTGVEILDDVNLLVEGWHDQYTVQDTTLIIGDVPVEEINILPTPDPGGER